MTFRAPRTHEEAKRAALNRQLEREDILIRGGQREALEWAARWIEGSSEGTAPATQTFAKNMAMSIRAEAKSEKRTRPYLRSPSTTTSSKGKE